MSMRAIFRFENLDSTKDLNDRFKGLFQKGIYEGGEVERPSSGYVVVSPFSAMSSDGMAVISDEEIAVTVGAGVYYIVLNARYRIGSEPIIELIAVPEAGIGGYSDAVKFAKVNGQYVDTNSESSRDVIDPVGRNHYKGVYSTTLPNPIENKFTKGDWFFFEQGNSDVYFIEMYTGIEDKYIPFKPVSEVETEIDVHRKNIVNTVGQDDTWKNNGYWQVPKLEEGTTAVMDETRADRDDYGSYHIAVSKWFATESLDKIWQYSVIPGSTDKHWEAVNQDFEHITLTGLQNAGIDLATEWIEDGVLGETFTMKPTRSNRFITQKFPMLPTANEKLAFSGNLRFVNNGTPYGLSVGIDNKYVTQKTAGVKFKKATLPSSITKQNGFYYYPITSDFERLYVGSGAIDSSKNYLKYLRYTVDNSDTDLLTANLTTFAVCVKNNNTYTEIQSSNVDTGSPWSRCSNRGFLKLLNTGAYYYFKTPVKLTELYYCTDCNIDASDFAPISNEFIYPYLEISIAKFTNKIESPIINVSNALSVTGSGTLSVGGATTLNTLSVSGATALGDTLTVTKGTTLNDTLTVAKATTLSDTLTVAKATTLNAALTVTSGGVTLNPGNSLKLLNTTNQSNAGNIEIGEGGKIRFGGRLTHSDLYYTDGNLWFQLNDGIKYKVFLIRDSEA